MISEYLDNILESMRNHFKQNRIFELFKSHCVSILENPGRHTISNCLCYMGKSQEDWSKDYRLFSKSKWSPDGCLNTILKEGLKYVPCNLPFIAINVDLTSTRKCGKNIPHTTYQLDPSSPPFQRGLMLAQRFLHFSLSLPQDHLDLPARSLPIRWNISPFVKKPGKRAGAEDWKEYRAQKKIINSNLDAINGFEDISETIRDLGFNRKILFVGDGGYSNQTIYKNLPASVDMVSRCRKDAKLCLKAENEGSKFYSSVKFTPEEVRKGEDNPLHEASIFYGGAKRKIDFKEMKNVYWQRGAGRRPLRLIVIKPVPYRRTKSGYQNYRDPAYLLTTDMESETTALIQAYFNRFEMELNHRDLKNNLGLGEGQVWSEASVERHPQTIVIAYSSLILSTLEAYGPNRTDNVYLLPPKWYRGQSRPTIEDMKRKLREELADNIVLRVRFGLKIPWSLASLDAASF